MPANSFIRGILASLFPHWLEMVAETARISQKVRRWLTRELQLTLHVVCHSAHTDSIPRAFHRPTKPQMKTSKKDRNGRLPHPVP